MKIHDMPEQNRPRERFLKHGPEALSDAELFAIILRTGTRGKLDENGELLPGENVIDMSNRLIKEYGLDKLFDCSVKELQKIKGIGPGKAMQVLAMAELGKRYSQAKKPVEKLNKLGYKINFDELIKERGEKSLGRMHIAKLLLKKYPELGSIRGIFDNFLGEGKKAYVQHEKSSIKNAVEIIHQAGGISILAHPALLKNEKKEIINEFISCKGDGIEVNYPYEGINNMTKDQANKIINQMRNMAIKNNLKISGGSDFHSLEMSKPLGSHGLTAEEYKGLFRK